MRQTSSMRRTPRGGRRRRGLSLVEVLISGVIMLWVLGILVAFSNLNSTLWQRGVLDAGTQGLAQRAIQSIAPDLRAARSVVTASSTAAQLTIQLPGYDGNGDLIIPLVNGNVVSYYLSDSTGSSSASGDILWRSVNGTPDTAWSMSGSKGRLVLAAGGLGFTYYPSAAPETVTLSITSATTSGSTTRNFVTSQEVMLRNKGL